MDIVSPLLEESNIVCVYDCEFRHRHNIKCSTEEKWKLVTIWAIGSLPDDLFSELWIVTIHSKSFSLAMGPVIMPLCVGPCRKRMPTSIRTCCRRLFALRALRRSCSALEMNSAASRRNTKGPRHKWHAKCTCTLTCTKKWGMYVEMVSRGHAYGVRK